MLLNYIWISFFLLGFIVALIKFLFFNQTDIFQLIVNQIFDTSENAVKISIGLIGVMSLFLGFMQIAEKSGLINFISKIVSPFFLKLFPEIKKDDKAIGQMMMNFSSNLLGLDNAATPFGLKAMEYLQISNKNKTIASNSQILFVALHATGLTLIPVSIIAQRVILNSNNPTSIFIPCMLVTFFSTISVIIIVGIKQKLNLLHPIVISVILGLSLLLIAFIYFIPKENLIKISSIGSNLLILLILFTFIISGIIKKINLFETFIEGAKKGLNVSIKIIPYLVAMLVAISIFRTSGILDLIINFINLILQYFNIKIDFLNALPTALLKPFSGTGARAMMIETMQKYGADSFVGQLSCIFHGTADTTFYIVALYFGIVQIKNIRYTIQVCLLADLIGIIIAICISHLFF